MTLKLIVEQAPHRQAEMEREYTGGHLVIGRGDDADWRLNDPDMYLSRRHAILSEEGGRVMVTDASSGGLYVDNAANPVGAGNSVPVEPGMRLRMGDFVMRVESAEAPVEGEARPSPTTAAPTGAGMHFSFDFGPAEEPKAPPKRPDTLPDPFGQREHGEQGVYSGPERKAPPRPLDQHDPFALDVQETQEQQRAHRPERSGGGYFDARSTPPRAPASEREPGPSRERVRDPFAATPPSAPPAAEPEHAPSAAASSPGDDIFGLSGRPGPEEEPAGPKAPPRDPFAETGTTPTEPRGDRAPHVPPEAAAPEPPRPEPEPRAAAPFAEGRHREAPRDASEAPASPRPAATTDAEALRTAFYRGVGLDPAQMPTSDPEAEMEEAGRRMRALVEGVMMLLRTRAQEKGRARVAQTLISNADVNPLKFLVTPEDALAALLHPRGQGYLAPDQAIAGAFRDLTDHQLRTWTALQTSLRRMIDRFDPAEIEREMETTGLMERLIAGGRSAKLWQLYTERYDEIARAAEEQFLGEVGADFREAYETKGST